MNGVHDMGGMDGFGPVKPEPDEPVFHAEWEKRAFALTLAMGMPGGWNIDMSRFARESLPPVWYKAAPYRSRAVADPRGVLKDFGVELPPETEIRVWDSTAELRYLVLPMRPEGTDGWSEDALADLVTRDSMIGTGLALRPDQVLRA